MQDLYVVTGGAGFIGSAFVARLNQAGITNIVIVDALGTDTKWKNLINLQYSEFFHKDEFLRYIEDDFLPTNIKAIIHLGACSATTEKDADFLMDNNFKYTRSLATYCLEKNIRFIYASSAATYGLGEKGYSDSDEAVRGLHPLNMYGYSKQLFDLWALDNGVLDRMVGIKFFNVFGPNEYHKDDMRSMVLKAYEQIKETGKVKLFKSDRVEYKDGEQKRDFVYVKDCVEVMYWLLENESVNGIFNLGSGQARSWKDLMHAVFTALGKSPQIEFIDMPLSLKGQYQYFTEAEMSKLKGAGYSRPMTTLEESVKDYVSNYLESSGKYL